MSVLGVEMNDIERKFRAMWIHGFKAGWYAARTASPTNEGQP